jgi:hypothetical protein
LVTDLFLPVEVCGVQLTNTDLCTGDSAVEDLGWGGRDVKAAETSSQQLQLIRQCTAAALNFAASSETGGDCFNVDVPIWVLDTTQTIADVFDECCDAESLCTAQVCGQDISESKCIERLDYFNNLEPDTMDCYTTPQAPFPFCPGLGENGYAATPEDCGIANGNECVNDRDLGPKCGGRR